MKTITEIKILKKLGLLVFCVIANLTLLGQDVFVSNKSSWQKESLLHFISDYEFLPSEFFNYKDDLNHRSDNQSIAPNEFGKNNAIYLSTELILGNYLGSDFSLNFISKGRYSFKVGYTSSIRNPISQPEDYSPDASALLYFRNTERPLDQFKNYQVGIGKIVMLKGKTRFNMSLGLGYTTIIEPKKWKNKAEFHIGEENYTWNYEKSNTVSLIINPRIEYPFSRIIGFTLSPMLQTSKDRTFYGIGIGFMSGLLR
jgi:hypothetical protein